MDFPYGSDSKESACNVGYPGSIPGLGRSPGKGNGNPLQYSCLENPMDRGAWQATVHGVAKSQTWLSDLTFLFFHQKYKRLVMIILHEKLFFWKKYFLKKYHMMKNEIFSKIRKKIRMPSLATFIHHSIGSPRQSK